MDQYQLAANILGMPGRLISASKSMYNSPVKDSIVVFNANVCTENGKIWYGDIDVGVDETKLVELAETLGQKIYVIREMDGRFENEGNPKIDHAVYVTP